HRGAWRRPADPSCRRVPAGPPVVAPRQPRLPPVRAAGGRAAPAAGEARRPHGPPRRERPRVARCPRPGRRAHPLREPRRRRRAGTRGPPLGAVPEVNWPVDRPRVAPPRVPRAPPGALLLKTSGDGALGLGEWSPGWRFGGTRGGATRRGIALLAGCSNIL